VQFFIYAFFMLLWGWILSGAYVRYILPLISSVYSTVDAMKESGEAVPRALSFILKIIMTVSQAYVLGAWSAYCVLRTMSFMQHPDASGWLYYPTAFLICEGILGIVAKRETYRGFFTVIHTAMAMGFFVMFALNPYFLASVYPWFPPLMKISIG